MHTQSDRLISFTKKRKEKKFPPVAAGHRMGRLLVGVGVVWFLGFLFLEGRLFFDWFFLLCHYLGWISSLYFYEWWRSAVHWRGVTGFGTYPCECGDFFHVNVFGSSFCKK